MIANSNLKREGDRAIRWIAATARARFAFRIPHSAFRSGLTLIELLIVIAILTTIVAAAIPLLSPSSDSRRIREASRGINTFISGAKARAIALRRPYGVALKKLSEDTGDPADSGVCLELFYVEQPPAFTGFDDTSRVMIAPNSIEVDGHPELAMPNTVWILFVRSGNEFPRARDKMPDGIDQEYLPPDFLRPGDIVRVGRSEYELVMPDVADGDPDDGVYNSDGNQTNYLARPVNNSGNVVDIKFDNRGRAVETRFDTVTGQMGYYADDGGSGELIDSATYDGFLWSEPLPYKVLRQPARTSAPPYQLPQGMAIDLRASGMRIELRPSLMDLNPGGIFHRPEVDTSIGDGTEAGPEAAVDNADPVVIMFAPEGSIERIHLNQANQNPNTISDPERDEIFDGPVVSNIYLLVGRRELIPVADLNDDLTLDPAEMRRTSPDLTEAEREEITSAVNWLNGESRWVVIGAQTGRIASEQNAFVPLQTWSLDDDHPFANTNTNNLQRRAMQIAEARQFAREMSQSGGR